MKLQQTLTAVVFMVIGPLVFAWLFLKACEVVADFLLFVRDFFKYLPSG